MGYRRGKPRTRRSGYRDRYERPRDDVAPIEILGEWMAYGVVAAIRWALGALKRLWSRPPVARPPGGARRASPSVPAAPHVGLGRVGSPAEPPEDEAAAVARIAALLKYRRAAGVLTKGERMFWHPLRMAAGERFVIFCKVRLADLATEPDGRAGAERRFKDLGDFHVDFLLCHPETTAPLLAVELDDATHRGARSLRRDRFKNAVLAAIRIPVYRVRAAQAYDPIELAEKIDGLLRNRPA